jgi:chemotaxis protein MotB
MRIFNESKDERDHSSGLMSTPNLLAGVILVFFLFLAMGLKYVGDLKDNGSNNNTNESVTDETDISSSDQTGTTVTLDELLAREKKLDEEIAAIKEIAGIRTRIISELETEIGKTSLEMNIDSTTGDISLSEALLFGVGIDTVSDAGKKYLDIFVPVYLSVVLSSENIQYIDQITIEGHTDDKGSYLDNLDLSQRRAASVVTYIFQNELNILPDGTAADSYFAISGRSYALMVENNGAIDRTASRRVEFKFRLKDYDFIKQMQDIYEGDN